MNNNFDIYREFIIKKYNSKEGSSKFSNIDNEIFCIKKFSSNNQNPYCPNILRRDDTSYMIQKYSFDIGTTSQIDTQKIKRVFFSISYDEFEKQMDEILTWLTKNNIQHRDINPANLIFYEKEKRFKLIDFYFSKTHGITVGDPPLLNRFYSTDDQTAMTKIKSEVKNIYNKVTDACNEHITPLLDKIGSKRFDGSSVDKGILYHLIDIPFFEKRPAVVNTKSLVDCIINNISSYPKSVVDIGCAEGLYSYNILRQFAPDKLYMYEADPYVNAYLKKVKEIFNIKEMDIRSKLTTPDDLPEAELVIMLNVHMWLYKNLGKDMTNSITQKLVKSCKEMFFITAGSESGGMFTIKDLEFSNKKEIEKYFLKLGAKNVYYIKQISIHCGIRHLFKISNL